MAERRYLHLLILCGILCQGIIATSDEDSKQSSDLLIRKRRVINHLPCGLSPTKIKDANYLVNIKDRGRSTCVGAILTHYTVITAALCFPDDILTFYKVLSGGAFDIRSKIHTVTSKVVYEGRPPHQHIDGIALITVDPLFEYSKNTGYISLHVGPLPVGTLVTVRGWGFSYPSRPAPRGLQRRLRTITLPIMNHDECQYEARPYFHVTEKHICTHDEEQYCARSDIGAPLVVNNSLAGIHVAKGEAFPGRNPEIYVDLRLPDYRTWINENTLLL